MTPKIAICGFGTMGEVLAKGLVRSGEARAEDLALTVASERRAAARRESTGFAVGTDSVAAASGADVVFLCVKPHAMTGLVEELASAGALDHGPVVVSIAAGVRLADLVGRAERARWIRVMPNTPCQIGEGMSVLAPGPGVDEQTVGTVERLFAPLGRTLVLDERYMDIVTGLSASGPAFVYVIIEALAEGGVMMGLPRRIATTMAAQMVRGASTMVLETDRHPAELKDDVTTPAGCTISALMALEDGKLRSVLARGVQEAARAAAELRTATPPGSDITS